MKLGKKIPFRTISRLGKSYYLFHFDLNTKKLIETFGEKSYRNAYKKIATFFYKNDVSHDQYSGYRTDYPVSRIDALYIAIKLALTYPDIIKCADRFSFSKAEKNYEISELLISIIDRHISQRQLNQSLQSLEKDKLNNNEKTKTLENNTNKIKNSIDLCEHDDFDSR